MQKRIALQNISEYVMAIDYAKAFTYIKKPATERSNRVKHSFT